VSPEFDALPEPQRSAVRRVGVETLLSQVCAHVDGGGEEAVAAAAAAVIKAELLAASKRQEGGT